MTQELEEKLKRILNSEISKTYFDNITKPLGDKTKRCNIISGVYNINSFIHNIFLNSGEDDVIVQDEINSNKISSLIINKKLINIKSLSYKTTYFYFKCFPFRQGDYFNIEVNLSKALEKLKEINYFLFIVIFFDRERNIIKYNFYLKPSYDFIFDVGDYEQILSGYKGKNWLIRNNKEFNFYINKDSLTEPIFTYYYNS